MEKGRIEFSITSLEPGEILNEIFIFIISIASSNIGNNIANIITMGVNLL